MTRKVTGTLNFKRGSIYDRNTIWEALYPGDPLPTGGDWNTGYALADNYENLIIFMNIGIPGKSGEDYENHFDDKTNTIKWFGKPKSHSNQKIFKKLINNEMNGHFFARWNNKSTKFTYLGIGTPVDFQDNVDTKQGKAIKLTLTCRDIREIINYTLSDDKEDISIELKNKSSFVIENHLELHIEKNWESTEFSKKYNLVKRQYETIAGPCDFLCLSKDKTEYLVIELKKDEGKDIALA